MVRGIALSLAAATLLRAVHDAPEQQRQEELKRTTEPKPAARPPRPVDVLPPIRPASGKVYRGGSVPGGARRAIERELRAQDECFYCEGSGWQCSAHPTRGGPVFDRCDGCGNPRGLPSP